MKTKLSVIIPVFNEEKTIKKILKMVEDVKIKGIEKEIIIVDDFSTDNTRKILEAMEKKHKIYYNDKNRGKGASVVFGLGKASGDIIIIQDADLEYSPLEYPKLISPILDKKYDVVYGSRLLKPSFKQRDLHYLGNKLLSVVTTILYFKKITDMETCYKAFRREILDGIRLRSKRFDFEPEITAKILKKKYRLIEIPITFKPRSFKEGKKITWIDGIKHIYYLVKYRFID